MPSGGTSRYYCMKTFGYYCFVLLQLLRVSFILYIYQLRGKRRNRWLKEEVAVIERSGCRGKKVSSEIRSHRCLKLKSDIAGKCSGDCGRHSSKASVLAIVLFILLFFVSDCHKFFFNRIAFYFYIESIMRIVIYFVSFFLASLLENSKHEIWTHLLTTLSEWTSAMVKALGLQMRCFARISR